MSSTLTTRGKRKTNRRAFTLVETLAAALILSIAAVTIGAITTRSLQSTAANGQYETAWQLLDRQLTVIDYIGIDEFIAHGQMDGEFQDVEPAYKWEVETAGGDYDNLEVVQITVSWHSEGRRHLISAETMFNGEGSLVLTGEETAE